MPRKLHELKGSKERRKKLQGMYTNRRWRRARVLYLYDHPLCTYCQAVGRTTPATVVDHKTPHNGNHVLFWNRENWQALCQACHNKKSREERELG